MSSTTDLDVPYIDPNQLGKAATANTAFDALDKALSEQLVIQADDGDHNSPYTIPYGTSDEPVGTKTALRFVDLVVQGTLTGAWTAIMPAGKKKLFLVSNTTGGGYDVIVKVTGQTGVTVPPGETWLCYLDGTDVVQRTASGGGGSQPFDIGNFVEGTPTNGQVLMRFVAARTVVFPGNFANNRLVADIAATSTVTFDITKNGSSVGSAQVANGDTTATWSSSGGSPVTLNAGDVLKFIAPNPADVSLSGIAWTFSGTR